MASLSVSMTGAGNVRKEIDLRENLSSLQKILLGVIVTLGVCLAAAGSATLAKGLIPLPASATMIALGATALLAIVFAYAYCRKKENEGAQKDPYATWSTKRFALDEDRDGKADDIESVVITCNNTTLRFKEGAKEVKVQAETEAQIGAISHSAGEKGQMSLTMQDQNLDSTYVITLSPNMKVMVNGNGNTVETIK